MKKLILTLITLLVFSSLAFGEPYDTTGFYLAKEGEIKNIEILADGGIFSTDIYKLTFTDSTSYNVRIWLGQYNCRVGNYVKIYQNYSVYNIINLKED